MSLTTIVACLALQAGPLEPPLTPSEPQPKRGAVNFDQLPPPPTVSDDVRVKRAAGAFAGGLVGFAAGMALVPAGDGACPTAGFFGGPCVNALHVGFGVLAPILSATGAWAGFQLMGGNGGWATPLAALAPAGLMGLWLLALARDMDAVTSVQLLPFAAAAGVLFAGTAALLLEVRARQVEGLGAASERGGATAARVALVALAGGVGLGVSGTLAVALISAAILGSPALAPLVAVAIIGGVLGSGAGVWGLHRALGGRGSFASAMVGIALGSLVAIGSGILFAVSQGGFTFSPVRNAAGAALFAEVSIAAGLFAPMLALEWSHTNAIDSALPKVTFAAAPVREGGMMSASVRF